MTFSIPINAQGKGGTALVAQLPEQPGAAREEAIYQLFANGAIPMLLRFPFDLTLSDGANTITLEVLPDVLGVGMDDDWVRMPMAAPTAQRIADYYNASLITRKLSDAIWAACSEIAPIPEAWYNVDGGHKMLVTSSFAIHNAAIQKALIGTGYTKVSGTKKDVVLTPQLLANPGKVAIYGWHKLDGKPIQGLNAKTHEYTYVDYSHGIRLIAQDCLVNGAPAKFSDVLKDPVLSKLVSDEGPSTFARYRTDYPGTSGGSNPPPTIPTGENPPATKPPGTTTAPGGRPPAPSPPLPVAKDGGGGAAVVIALSVGALFLATRLLCVDML